MSDEEAGGEERCDFWQRADDGGQARNDRKINLLSLQDRTRLVCNCFPLVFAVPLGAAVPEGEFCRKCLRQDPTRAALIDFERAAAV